MILSATLFLHWLIDASTPKRLKIVSPVKKDKARGLGHSKFQKTSKSYIWFKFWWFSCFDGVATGRVCKTALFNNNPVFIRALAKLYRLKIFGLKLDLNGVGGPHTPKLRKPDILKKFNISLLSNSKRLTLFLKKVIFGYHSIPLY